MPANFQIEHAAHVAGVIFWASLMALMVTLLLHPTGRRWLSVDGSSVFKVLAAIFALLQIELELVDQVRQTLDLLIAIRQQL